MGIFYDIFWKLKKYSYLCINKININIKNYILGTNFYRIPTEEEVNAAKDKLLKRINEMELTPKNIEKDFCFIEWGDYFCEDPWREFLTDMKIHLGKRSAGWKFLWNFNGNRFYSNKNELLKFIRSGRVVDEYGDLIENEEFIKMALEWGEPDGHVYNESYVREHSLFGIYGSDPQYYSKIIDGLVVSSHDEFC